MAKLLIGIVVLLLVSASPEAAAEHLQLAAKLRHEQNIEGHVESISASPDGRLLAAAYNVRVGASPGISKRSGQGGAIQGTVVIWDVGKKEVAREIGCGGVIQHLRFSADGKMLAVAHCNDQAEQRVRVLEVPAWKEAYSFGVNQGEKRQYVSLSALVFTPDNRRLLVGVGADLQAGIMVFDASRGQYLETLKAGETSVSSISFNADGTLMTSVSEDRIQVWHTDGFRERNRFSVGRGQTAAMSPDGSVVAVGTTGSRNYPGKVALTLHDAKTGKEMVDFGCLKSGSLLQFTPDGRYLIQGLGGLLVVYDAKSGKQLSVTDGPTFQSMVLVPNTKLLATGNQSGSLWLWKVGAE